MKLEEGKCYPIRIKNADNFEEDKQRKHKWNSLSGLRYIGG